MAGADPVLIRLRRIVKTLDDEALSALANKGLLRRAQKDLEGARPGIVGTAGGKVRIEVGDATHVLVAPGEHQITVRWKGSQNITRMGQVRGRLAAGSTYVIEAEPDGALRTVLFTLVDKGPNYDEQCLERPTFGGEPKGRGC